MAEWRVTVLIEHPHATEFDVSDAIGRWLDDGLMDEPDSDWRAYIDEGPSEVQP